MNIHHTQGGSLLRFFFLGCWHNVTVACVGIMWHKFVCCVGTLWQCAAVLTVWRNTLFLRDLGIESRWGRDIPHPFRPASGTTQPLVQWLSGLFPGVRAAGAWLELYLSSPPGPSWPVMGRTLLWSDVWLTVHLISMWIRKTN